MQIKAAVMVALAATSLSGCATVVHGANDDLKFRSSPTGAKVQITNGQSCTTPCKIKVKRKYDLRADFLLEGYKPTYVLVQSKMSGAAVGNLLLGGIIGGVVDGSNGASNRLVPSPVNVKLAKADSSDEAQLLDKKDKLVSTVEVNNEKVRYDVSKTIGADAAGLRKPLTATTTAAQEPAPAPVPAQAPTSEPAPAAVPAPVTTSGPGGTH